MIRNIVEEPYHDIRKKD